MKTTLNLETDVCGFSEVKALGMDNSIHTATADDTNGKHPISTLVFMDLEATGLPSFVGKKNVHITEMSFVAIDRESFEVDTSLRVRNKLSLCVRPRACISPTAMSITGLYNDVLEKQEKFDDSIPKLLEYFFRRLQRPICLLAHNGNRYDFPLLQAELKNINYALDPQILCADTLQAIRFIVSNPIVQPTDPVPPTNSQMPTNNEPTTIRETPQENNEKDIDPDIEILSQDMDIFKDIEEPTYFSGTSECRNSNKHSSLAMTTISKVDDKTPPKPFPPGNVLLLNPKKKIKLDLNSTPRRNYHDTVMTNFHTKRQLFADKHHVNKSDSHTIPSRPLQFSLEKLYKHFFGENPPVSHYAEADCIALSKVCQRLNKDFLKWIDENSSAFCETKAMW